MSEYDRQPAAEVTLRIGEPFIVVGDDTNRMWTITGIEARDGWVPLIRVEPGVAMAPTDG